MLQSIQYSAPGSQRRNAVVAGLVVALHAAGLWALQSGLARAPVEIAMPAEVLIAFIAPAAAPAPPAPQPSIQPAPQPTPQPVRQPSPPAPKKPTEPKPLPQVQPAPKPVAAPPAAPTVPVDTHPSPIPAAAEATAPAESAPAPAAPAAAPAANAGGTSGAPATSSAPSGPTGIELPSSHASYLNNPKPVYPAISKRLGEQGKVVLRVLIDTDGLPQKVEVKESSGFARLDRQAVDAVMRWRFVPGKRNGVPEAMWNLVPVNFVLQQ